MKTIYECPQSKGIRVSTILAFLFVLIALVLGIYFFTKLGRSAEAIILTLVLVGVAFSSFLLFPLYIISDDEGIGIKTLVRTIRIPFQDIDHIERLDSGKRLFGIKDAVRLFGIGGVFGFIGWFRLKGVGIFRSYITDEKKAFLIYRKNGVPIAISVSEPDEFLPYYLKGGGKMNILDDFSTALLQARQRKGVTQENIAFALNISHATYNAWECGHRICPYKHIITLISYFDDDIFTRRMLRLMLSLQHNMAGLSGKSKSETASFYIKLISLLAEECAEWMDSFENE